MLQRQFRKMTVASDISVALYIARTCDTIALACTSAQVVKKWSSLVHIGTKCKYS